MLAPMTAAEDYAARVTAFEQMRERWRGGLAEDAWGGGLAEQARADPRRAPDANLEQLLTYIEPRDVVIDVGGGAGRVGLPLAMRCRELLNVDPSTAMRTQFEQAAAAAGIGNARVVPSGWPDADALQGDVVLTTHVTYFVRDIVPFVQALERAARRRVIIGMWSIPPPVMGWQLSELVFGVPFEPPPGMRELLPVLWDLDILPDVRVLPLPMRQNYTWLPQASRELMIERALQVAQWHGRLADVGRARSLIEQHFDELFMSDQAGYRPIWPAGVRELLITWSAK